jgi:8-oxo-dGTP pyrophosphatase MutT (NUDIX family)
MSSSADADVYGERVDGIVYVERPGVYAIITDGEGRVLVVDENDSLGLPGGGIDQGEAVDEALRRELDEETGLGPVGWRYLDVARQLVQASDGPFEKIERFYRVEVERPVGDLPDGVSWLPIGDAIDQLTEEAQRWAVQQYGNSSVESKRG